MDELEKDLAKKSVDLILGQMSKLCHQMINMGEVVDGPITLIFRILAITSKTISGHIGSSDELIDAIEGFDLNAWKETPYSTLPITTKIKVSNLNQQLDAIIANAKR